VRYGKVDPAAVDRRFNVDPRIGVPPLRRVLDGLATGSALADAIEAQKPTYFVYTGLKKELARMRSLAAAGGWPTVPTGAKLEPGDRDARIVAVRERLRASGELGATASLDSEDYDRELEKAVALFQDRHQLTPDSVIGDATIEAMNLSVAARVAQLRVNLERTRWVQSSLKGVLLLVNLPAFEMYMLRDAKRVWDSRVQVGDEARATPAFRADLRSMELNPDWNVPPTVLQKDIIEGMRKGEDPITKKGLIILDGNGRAVNPRTIRWTGQNARSFPYRLRQPPGPENALGRVKFNLPNPYTIYLHDTPNWELFGTNDRTFSSGCIRIEYAFELATLVLEREGWTAARLKAAIASGKTQIVNLKRPIPVLLVYWTASVNPAGEPQLARDIYGLDPLVMRVLDPTVRLPRPPPPRTPPARTTAQR
jgi:murein L,D-transpeptidase YcbB/YkuD